MLIKVRQKKIIQEILVLRSPGPSDPQLPNGTSGRSRIFHRGLPTPKVGVLNYYLANYFLKII